MAGRYTDHTPATTCDNNNLILPILLTNFFILVNLPSIIKLVVFQNREAIFNWLNIFYGFEWVVFAGFAIFMWWRLVADDYRRQQEDEADLAEWQAQQERLAQPDNQLHGDDQHADREPTPHSPSAKE